MSTREEIAMWTNLTEARVRVSWIDLDTELSCFCDFLNRINRDMKVAILQRQETNF